MWRKSEDGRIESREKRFLILPVKKYRGPIMHYQIHDRLTGKAGQRFRTQADCKQWAEDVLKLEEDHV